MARRKNVTIYDVAKEAGVAASTVSRALSRPDRVSADTAARIFGVAKQLGYYREGASYSEPMRLAKTLVIVVADLSNLTYADVVAGFQRSATEAGYATVVIDTQESHAMEQRTLKQIIQGVDGVALAASRLDSGAIYRIEKTRPLVLLNRFMQGVTCVLPDTERGVEQVCRYLRDLGHRSLLYIGGPEMSWANAMRWRSVQVKASEFGLKLEHTVFNVPDLTGGASAVDAWESSRTTAVLAFNDLMAIGFMREAQQRGFNIPEDVSVIGIDDSMLSRLVKPELSSLSLAADQIGVRGAWALIRQVEHRSLRERHLIHVPSEFIPRVSTGAARMKVQ